MTDAMPAHEQFTEFWEGRSGLTFGVRERLFHHQSPFQLVEVWDTDAFGHLLTLDGKVMVTDRDEFVYHEMISHPALAVLPEARRALVVGGGDGGTVREILRHPGIEQVDLVEIDQIVIDASRRYFPEVSAALDDPRLHIYVADGVEFVRQAGDNAYDLVIVDSTDPIGIAEGLFGETFYRDCARVLNGHGVLCAQMESPFYRQFEATFRAARALLQRIFPISELYLAFIPTYPMGMWAFAFSSNGTHPLRDYDRDAAAERLASFAETLRYYNADVHTAAFALPNFVKQMVG